MLTKQSYHKICIAAVLELSGTSHNPQQIELLKSSKSILDLERRSCDIDPTYETSQKPICIFHGNLNLIISCFTLTIYSHFMPVVIESLTTCNHLLIELIWANCCTSGMEQHSLKVVFLVTWWVEDSPLFNANLVSTHLLSLFMISEEGAELNASGDS